MSSSLEAGEGAESNKRDKKCKFSGVPHSGLRARSSRSPSLTGPLLDVLLLPASLLRPWGEVKRPTPMKPRRQGVRRGLAPVLQFPSWGVGGKSLTPLNEVQVVSVLATA